MEHIAQLLQRGPAESSKKSITEEGPDELDDFTANIKQATTQLRLFSQRWHNATITKSGDVRRLERRGEEIEREEELLRQKTGHMAEQEELLKHKADDICRSRGRRRRGEGGLTLHSRRTGSVG